MASTSSATKAARQSEKKRQRRKPAKSRIKTLVFKALGSTALGEDPAAAEKATLEAIQAVDRGVPKGLLHRNTAARRKSRLMRSLNALQAADTSAT